MFEWLVDVAAVTWTWLLASGHDIAREVSTSVETIRLQLTGFNPTQRLVLWIQFGVGLLTVVWIIFQFAWLRRLNEARLERHLEGVVATEREELADERKNTLDALDRIVKSRGLWRLLLLAWAHIRLTISLILRILTIGTTRGLADHNFLLLKVGDEERARGLFTEVAREAIKKMKLYRDAIDNKTLEAQSALIFAGRIALMEKRTAAGVMLFGMAKNLKDDADARLLIGKQMTEGAAFEPAMREFQSVINMDVASPGTKSEAHRAMATVHMKLNAHVRARNALSEAEQIDAQQQDPAGAGKTHELIGDLFARRADRQRAALTNYNKSAQSYATAELKDRERAVRRKIRRLETGKLADGSEGWVVRALESLSRTLLRLAERRRAQAQMRAA